MTKKVIVGLIIIVILAVGYFGIALFIANALTSPTARHLEISPQVIATNYQPIEFRDPQNLKLKGWLFRGTSDKLVIMVSGILNNRVNTGYYTPLIAKDLLSQGYSVLMYDHRGTGESEGDRVSYGVYEGGGIIAAVNFAKSQGFNPSKIAIIADSLGAISTVNVASQLTAVGALVVDSPAQDMKTTVSSVLAKEKGIPSFFHPTIFWLTKLLYGFDISTVKPSEKIKLVPERVFLFLHGKLDPTIPLSNSQELLKLANPNSKLVIFANGEHIETYKTNPDLYRSEVFSFLRQELK